MSITFNGQVTINGNVEMYENRSMKIATNQVSVGLDDLKSFIEDNLKDSPNKSEYSQAADSLANSTDESKLKKALIALKNMGQELGKNILITGIPVVVSEIVKKIKI